MRCQCCEMPIDCPLPICPQCVSLMAEDNEDQHQLIVKLDVIIEELMAGVPHIVCDIGRLNETLMALSKYLREKKP